MELAKQIVSCPVSPRQLSEIAEKFPDLLIEQVEPFLVLSGQFELVLNGESFDSYSVRIEVEGFPKIEPKVFERGGRVKDGQHRNGSGTCCTCVFEVWRAGNPNASLVDFLTGPVRNFFLGHQEFERTKVWPFGELSHGLKGIVEAAAELLGISADEAKVTRYLRFLARRKGVRYRRCPCGSGDYLHHCHGNELRELHHKIEKAQAQSILQRLLESK
ncbi:hypothetical protein N8A98_15080 [Devosia neptuniae]|uniref:SEC-C motif-containing protein n=1 Tax=Devosia neptuniae TaxID=191302 RepID=A0ABY6C8W4_9HYPH|nr:hypothetical protein [Devosia neptuniae]UXN68575.1 hypothetical protein N8A98_15080 [Devosia neptuniae]